MRSILIMGGSFITASCAAFLTPPIWPPNPIELAIICGAVLTMIGAIYAIVTDVTPGETLDAARRAVEAKRHAEFSNNELYSDIQIYEEASERLLALYMAATQGREYVEQMSSMPKGELSSAIESCLQACGRDLKVAMGFSMGDFWTLCVYQTLEDERGRYLKCVAHERSVPCGLQEARSWREGIGPGGVALARNDEVVVADILAKEVVSIFRISPDSSKPDDARRYRSMCAVPINIGDSPSPWGVVLATSSNPGHFEAGNGYGVSPEEGVRTAAGLCALLIAVDSLVAKPTALHA